MHYNWHRHYDPSLGRYTQPDPLGFVDGPSVLAYVRNVPLSLIDPQRAGVGTVRRLARCMAVF
ncbi:MAG: RHS repeat-associated core domain-containing protein [Hyphomicrobium sp.]